MPPGRLISGFFFCLQIGKSTHTRPSTVYMTMKNKSLLIAGALGVAAALLISGTAFAQTPPQGGWQGQGGQHAGYGGMRVPGSNGGMRPAVFGTVSAINGDSLTVTSKGFGGFGHNATSTTSASVTTYTVDATNATVFKNNATSSLSVVAVGDTVVVQGTVSGTSVIATTIRDGIVPMMQSGMGGRPGIGGPGMNKGGPTILGNGQPIVGGTVSAVSGSTITITTAKGGITYTVDASNAVIGKDNATSSVSSIAVGDNVTVQGAVNGTSVTASTVIDSGMPHAPGAMGGNSGGNMFAKVPVVGSLLGRVGGFFQHLFGFF